MATWRQRRGAVPRLRGGNRPGGTAPAPRRVVSEPPPRGSGRHGPHPKASPWRLWQRRRTIGPSAPGAPIAWPSSRRAAPATRHLAVGPGTRVSGPARAAHVSRLRAAPAFRHSRLRIAAVVDAPYSTRLAGRPSAWVWGRWRSVWSRGGLQHALAKNSVVSTGAKVGPALSRRTRAPAPPQRKISIERPIISRMG